MFRAAALQRFFSHQIGNLLLPILGKTKLPLHNSRHGFVSRCGCDFSGLFALFRAGEFVFDISIVIPGEMFFASKSATHFRPSWGRPNSLSIIRVMNLERVALKPVLEKCFSL